VARPFARPLAGGASIKHALVVRYLYAGYSLRDVKWRGTLLAIAREEMAHLLTVRNVPALPLVLCDLSAGKPTTSPVSGQQYSIGSAVNVERGPMTITKIVILPPLAFARFGSHPKPLDSYTLKLPQGHETPLDNYRCIVPEPTFTVSDNGEIESAATPDKIVFKEGDKVRPVAPFFELWAECDDGSFNQLNMAHLESAKLEWRVNVANLKVFRRTQDEPDRVEATTGWFSDHEVYELRGSCDHFVTDGYIKFGSVRYIKPNTKHPEIRLRFTPSAGLIYGPDETRTEPFLPPGRRIHKSGHTKWKGWEHKDADDITMAVEDVETVPPSLFAVEPPAPPWLHTDKKAVSRGYLDDACDGFVRARLTVSGNTLEAKARIGVAPPHYAPDSLFIRNLVDDLEQANEGTEITRDSTDRALDIVRRAFETVRFMNVAVMNGNDFKGKKQLELDSMPAEEAFVYWGERQVPPIFSPCPTAKMVLYHHRRVYEAIRQGTGAQYAERLRRPDDVGKLTDERQKMPALMCGADNLYLALTRRQISAIENSSKVADQSDKDEYLWLTDASLLTKLVPRNQTAQRLTAELMYKAAGTPLCSHPITAISNCCPGLEFDFRAVWRRLFKGIMLVEHDNLVVDADEEFQHLRGCRLLKVEDQNILVTIEGPDGVLTTKENPDGVRCKEWSNSLAPLLKKTGKKVTCTFSREQQVTIRACPNSETDENVQKAELEIRNFFEPGSAVISEELAGPGELTQGLCSPWQNDFRECSCYYWASSRPDFVNVKADGTGDNWLQKERTGNYVPDDYADPHLIHYDDLFNDWERLLEFQIGGKDAVPTDSSDGTKKPQGGTE
jgi:hypothetical protein